ncbi:MAG TPA: glycosyltransferase family 39 protein [Anaerolineae bacterium]|nr:glycosyltransferase family 39 protein [Anaerolineae bacterium]
MSRRRWIVLLMLGLCVAGLGAVWVQAPGYMDADYYQATAERLASGQGFTEPFLWNYLDDPNEIPHPSHMYWMPLTSLVAAAPMAIFGIGFRIAQIPFILLTAALPLLTASTALHLGMGERKAWLAGLLACTSGFYLPYFVTTDNFSIFAVVGSAALWMMAVAVQRPAAHRWILIGAFVGLAHMARADGLLLLVPAMLAVWYAGDRRFSAAVLVLVGYGVLMAPWWTRNILLLGTPLPQGASRSIWLVRYDELYSYPASILTPERWWSAGWQKLLQARGQALLSNLQSLLAVNGYVFLAPLMIVGIQRGWKRPLVRIAMTYLILLMIVMSLVFPHIGARGGFFHSSAALMPVLWVLAVEGLERIVSWAGERRGWVPEQSLVVFNTAAIALGAALALFVYWGRVIGPDPSQPVWSSSDALYSDVGEQLKALDPEPGIVAVNNPPGFYRATDLEAVVIPNGNPETLYQVVERYDVEWIILEANHPEALQDFYALGVDIDWLETVVTLADREDQAVHLMRVRASEGMP